MQSIFFGSGARYEAQYGIRMVHSMILDILYIFSFFTFKFCSTILINFRHASAIILPSI